MPFIPWRERLKSSGFKPDSQMAARLDREDALTIAAIAVFGNEARANRWLGRKLATDDWLSPYQIAGENKDGLERMLGELDRLRMSIRPLSPPPGQPGRPPKKRS